MGNLLRRKLGGAPRMKSFQREVVRRETFTERLVIQQDNGSDSSYRVALLEDLKRQAWAEGFLLVPREANHCDDTAALRSLVRNRYIEALELATGELRCYAHEHAHEHVRRKRLQTSE